MPRGVYDHGRRPGVCGVPWPPSLDDAQPLPCARPANHPPDQHEAQGLTWPVLDLYRDTVRMELAGLIDPNPTIHVERYRPPVPPPVRRPGGKP